MYLPDTATEAYCKSAADDEVFSISRDLNGWVFCTLPYKEESYRNDTIRVSSDKLIWRNLEDSVRFTLQQENKSPQLFSI